MSERARALEQALRELTAMVRGECPSLLNEDSGGNGDLSCQIEKLLAVDTPPSGASSVDAPIYRQVYIVTHYPEGGLRGVHASQAGAEAEIADRVVVLLFVNGFGEHADRLVMKKSKQEHGDLGGWSRDAVKTVILEVLRQEVR